MESWIGGWEGAKDFLALLHRLWHTKKFKIIKFKCFLLFCRYTTWGLPLKALALLAWRLAETPFLGCCFHSYESNHATHRRQTPVSTGAAALPSGSPKATIPEVGFFSVLSLGKTGHLFRVMVEDILRGITQSHTKISVNSENWHAF